MTNKLKYFIGNWKMFGDLGSFKIVAKINRFVNKFHTYNNKFKIILCVPSTLVYFFKFKMKLKRIFIGGQNCHFNQTYGPFTGHVNASMLKKAGAEYVILGHSENRAEGETNKLIKKKIKSLIDQNLNIIFCIGESLKEKKNGKTFSVLRKQMRESVEKRFNLKKIIFAYEPVWSIGTNRIPKKEQLEKIIEFIKKEYKRNFKSKYYPRVLYGGSVNNNNIRIFSKISNLDGFLIGGASQSSKKFIDIIKNYYK